jgi:protein gp37
MNKTSIAWVKGPNGEPGYSWNPFVGCPGCEVNCYAARLAATRLAHLPAYKGLAYIDDSGESSQRYRWTGEVRFWPEKLAEPLRRRKPAGIFVGDMGDIALLTNEQIAAIFGVMAATPRHRYYVLTKKPERIREWFEWITSKQRAFPGLSSWEECCWHAMNIRVEEVVGIGGKMHVRELPEARPWPLPNVVLMTSVTDQRTADARLPELLQCPAAVRGVSAEPLLGPVDFTGWLEYNPLHEATREERRDALSGGDCGMDRGASRRLGVEGSAEKSEQMESINLGEASATTQDRRCCGRRISGSATDGKWQADIVPSASPCVEGVGRPNPQGAHDQPQERKEGGQQAGEFGSGDLLREHEACLPNRPDERGRGTEPGSEIEQPGHGGHSPGVRAGRDFPGETRREIRGGVPDGIEDCEGGKAKNTGRPNGGLCGETEPTKPREKREGTISVIICGGESGPRARPCHVEWIRSVVRQCKAADVPVFVKQLGANAREGEPGPLGTTAEWLTKDRAGADPSEWPEDLRVRQWPKGQQKPYPGEWKGQQVNVYPSEVIPGGLMLATHKQPKRRP